MRILARVLEAQGSPEYRQRAVEKWEELIKRNPASSEDRFALARLLEASNDWNKAREQYRELVSQTENVRDLETFNRRSIYLRQFVTSLLRHHRAGDDKGFAEVQDVVGKLKTIQPNSLECLLFEVEVYRLRNQLDKGVKLIETFADRTDLTPAARGGLAEAAEKLGQMKVAERLYRKYADMRPDFRQGKMALAAFLGRHDHLKEALDVCEPLWPGTPEPEALALMCISMALRPDKSAEPAELNRIGGWLEQALAKKPQSPALAVMLGNLRERQRDYPAAENLYEQAIQHGYGGGVPYNNLAWLLALREGKLNDALTLVNQAIERKGPDLSEFLDTRGVVYLSRGEVQKAITDLEAAAKTKPTAPKFFHLAQAYLEAHDQEKAKQNLKEAKNKGLEVRDLHPLEEPAYRTLLSKLGAP
jgi:tetratricopeptide (TPR) repeat protein